MKFRDERTMNLETVKLFSVQTLHYATTGPTALEMDVFNNYCRQTHPCRNIFVHSCAPEKSCIRWACNFAASRLSHRAMRYVALVPQCGYVVLAAQ